jgi:hypothetical protein
MLWNRQRMILLVTAYGCSALELACGSDDDPIRAPINLAVDAGLDAGADLGATWIGSADCDACLRSYCGDPDAGVTPYADCDGDTGCTTTMTAFTKCYAKTPSLTSCKREIEDVRASSSAGGPLLDCYLLKCFFTICEQPRTLASK